MGCTPLHLACGRGDGELISRVLDAGGWVDAVDVFDHTPLRTGIWSRAGLSVYQLLVQHGANCNIQDDRGWTPLNDLIQVNAGLDCFQLLLQQGRANPTTCQASNGWTLLHDALAKSIHLDILQLLLKSGCGKLVHRESGSGLLPLAMVPNPSTSRQLLLTAFLAEQLVVILSINQLPIELVRLLKEYL
ncbi:hypothetical protein BASA81_006316 [Batrachochytrium salamandrivorans]|nr:hypothetical protein BASA81_006316 [Batrachochytrium salamandrivorans]